MPMIQDNSLSLLTGGRSLYPVYVSSYNFGKVTANVNPRMNRAAGDRCFLVQVRVSGELNELTFVICNGLRGSSVTLGSKGSFSPLAEDGTHLRLVCGTNNSQCLAGPREEERQARSGAIKHA